MADSRYLIRLMRIEKNSYRITDIAFYQQRLSCFYTTLVGLSGRLGLQILLIKIVVAMETRGYCSGVGRIPEHIHVVIFVRSRLDSLVFARLSVFTREELIIKLCRRQLVVFRS